MTKQAFIVLGPESSGTKLVTGLLIDEGCVGNDTDDQRFDKAKTSQDWEELNVEALPKDETPIVWRRSIPHGGRKIDIVRLVKQLRGYDYQVQFVITTRDWFPMMKSQLKKHQQGKSDSDVLANIRDAYQRIFQAADQTSVPFVMVSYESLVHSRGARWTFLENIGVRKRACVRGIKDENAKWYGE